MNDVVVLMSGGIDSTLLAHMAIADKRLHSVVFCDFGQPAVEPERRAVLLWGERHAIAVAELWVPLHGTMATGAGEKGPRIIPGRNLALLSRAMNYAAANRAREVWYGAIADDSKYYHDCRASFVTTINAIGRDSMGVGVRTPLIGYSKELVIAMAMRLGVDIGATWSCYEPRDGVACGTCDSCAARMGVVS